MARDYIVIDYDSYLPVAPGVVLIKAPGHTPGHQSLFLKLPNTGNVLLSGDLYHYPEEITYKKVPNFDTDGVQTAKSREKIEDFVKQNHAQLWIQQIIPAGLNARSPRHFMTERNSAG